MLLGLTLAALGIFTPIAWDWYTERAALEVRYLSSATLIDTLAQVEEVEIRFGDRQIRQLSRVELVLANMGRRPIEASDLARPFQIQFEGVRILDASIVAESPHNLAAVLEILPDSSTIQLTFSLLNQGDRVGFSVLLAGSEPRLSVDARIAGLRRVPLVDRRQDQRTGGVRTKILESRGLPF